MVAFVRCRFHGDRGPYETCAHIAQAVRAKRSGQAQWFVEVHVIVNGWGEPTLVCQPCREVARRNREEAKKEPGKGYFHDWGSDEEYLCEACAKEWYAAVGPGGLGELVNQALRAVGVKIP
ncbi:hypothetical protein HPC49_30930 [Pyxidicoccus fallax]|uniref:Uncharacterized protein n=1 Tax=Pyxidicoccus fallax TaxID=394095 RepID=A0A848LJK9_9BACT|nr:hypothetical protein [Pyxidicoccus fallax]NMO17878.1 hypothetical protein [Pyxidicoccus fallax]NPC82625.1 hypothetical protein [Pyxidicoccus fallax]